MDKRLLDLACFTTNPQKVEKRYVICSSPRCGTNWLASLLQKTQQLGAPFEHLTPASYRLVMERLNCSDVKLYLKTLEKHAGTNNGVFGTKLFYYFFDYWKPWIKFSDFKDYSFIYITREDKIAQAVSFSIAMQKKQWNSLQPGHGKAQYNYHHIKGCLSNILTSEAGWDFAFKTYSINPLKLTYEELISAPHPCVEKIAQHLEVNLNPYETSPTFVKQQTTELNEEFIARFKESFANDEGAFTLWYQAPPMLKRHFKRFKHRMFSRLNI